MIHLVDFDKLIPLEFNENELESSMMDRSSIIVCMDEEVNW